MFEKKYHNQSIGILFMLLACFFFSVNNNVIKLLSLSLSPFCMVFYKNFISFLLLIPFAIIIGRSILSLKHLNKHNICRGVIDVISVTLWFQALKGSQVSQAVAITFLTPFFISVIAIFALKERVDMGRWLLMLLGFCGALIIIQPSLNFNYHVLYAVGASSLWAISAVLFKKLTLIQDSFIIIFFLKGLKTLLSTPMLIYDFQLLNSEQVILLIFLGSLTNSAVYFVALAYKYASISVVVPFDFSRLVLTSVIALFIFDESISVNTVYGSIIILIASSLLANKVRNEDRGTKKKYGG